MMEEVLTSLTAVHIHTREAMVLEIQVKTEGEQHTVKSRFPASLQGKKRQFLTLKPLFTLPSL